jgi:hypothetical protein
MLCAAVSADSKARNAVMFCLQNLPAGMLDISLVPPAMAARATLDFNQILPIGW